MTSSPWSAAHVAAIAAQARPEPPVITAAQAQPLVPGIDLWDMWPVQMPHGPTAEIAGGVLWMALAAPIMGDPVLRHFKARIHLLLQRDGEWLHLGAACPPPQVGNREWSGSAILAADDEVLLFFTAGGIERAEGGYQQRLCQRRARLSLRDGLPALTGWTPARESVVSDDDTYVLANQQDGAPGTIKAWRDPAFFIDPADDAAYLVFAASLKRSTSSYNGCIGIARATDDTFDTWILLPPLVHADGLNNELERPHLIARAGRYYLFWSTQASVFNPEGPTGPTGLYGMVADALSGPWRPLNGTGLVIANPMAEPTQAFSWWVMGDLSVTSFVDAWGLKGRTPAGAEEARAHFGGTPAPFLKIALEGDSTRLLPGQVPVR